MIPSSIRSLNVLCIVGYLFFMGLAIDSKMVDALALYVSETDGRTVLQSGKVHVKPIIGKSSGERPVAVQSRGHTIASSGVVVISQNQNSVAPVNTVTGVAACVENDKTVSSTSRILPDLRSVMSRVREQIPSGFIASRTESAAETSQAQIAFQSGSHVAPTSAMASNASTTKNVRTGMSPNFQASIAALRAGIASTARPVSAQASAMSGCVSAKSAVDDLSSVSLSGVSTDDSIDSKNIASASGSVDLGDSRLSILSLIKSAAEKPWAYDPTLDRYVVRYDEDTTLVLTLRPSLQRIFENTFHVFPCKMGAAILQDPSTGAILAMTSFDGRNILSPLGGNFVSANWALKPSFPVASLFKIITAAAAIERKGALPGTPVRIGKRATIQLWKAFATSNNGVFGVVGRAVGRPLLQAYADAFGFNKPFYFDLPVSNSVAALPSEGNLLGQCAAGLNNHFEISPIHVSSIVSTILNRGRLMKPFLIESVIRKGQVVFRRKAFQLSQPISEVTAERIYEMMRFTTTQGTGKRGFHGYGDCPELADLCGGKTGTLTGLSPNYLFTWFGGFTRTAGRDLSLTVLCGQAGTNRIKATTIAGRISYELLHGHNQTPTMAIRSASR
ncbi:MAG: hypothetical protein HQM09_01465 [Candidatus Riflebacteria bacterium]|nr:hypothetical protein [Candidatus Riflebacteria bacterium]